MRITIYKVEQANSNNAPNRFPYAGTSRDVPPEGMSQRWGKTITGYDSHVPVVSTLDVQAGPEIRFNPS
jgi:hypothetical protein